MHVSRVLALCEDLSASDGDPDRIRTLLQDLGRQHARQGTTEEQLDMLGPVACHTARPAVFAAGLWSVEVERAWAHLFDLVAALMREGHRSQKDEEERQESAAASSGCGAAADARLDRAERRLRAVLDEKRRSMGPPPPSSALAAGAADSFPTLTHVVILKDTWTGLVRHMHELGLAAVVKLFKINYNLRCATMALSFSRYHTVRTFAGFTRLPKFGTGLIV